MGGDPDTASPLLFDAQVAALGISAYTDTAHPERVTVVDDPVLGAARKVMRFDVYDTDIGPTENPRAQLNSPRVVKEGMDVWFGWSTLFPSGFPAKLPAGQWPFLTIAETYGPPYAGVSPVRVAMRSDTPGLSFMAGYSVIADLGAFQFDTWYDFALRERMSADPAIGFAELWVNTGAGWRRVAAQHLATLVASNNGGDNYHKVASYRMVGMFDLVTLYHADHKIGHSFEQVAPNSHG